MCKIVLACGCVLGFVAVAIAADAKLVLVGSPTIIANPGCNLDGTGFVKAKVRNEGSNGTAAISLYLTAIDITSKPPGKSLAGIISVRKIKGAEDEQPIDKKDLAAGEEMWIRIDVTGIKEPGEWETTLQNENVDIGKVRIVRTELPFPVTLDVPTPDAPELTFVKGQPSSFRLKNDGPDDFQINWEYSIEGHTLRPTDSRRRGWWTRMVCSLTRDCRTEPVAPSPVWLPKDGITPINFHAPRNWFGSGFTGLFKDNAQDGRLMISRVDSNCPAPISNKVFKIKTHLATSAGSIRELRADWWIFIFLLAGGLCSLALNFALPNQMRRQKLNEKLDGLGRQIRDLRKALASSLRVQAGRELKLLRDRLHHLTWTNSDFSGEMQNIEQAAARLDTRLQLLGSLGTARSDFEVKRSANLAPTVILSMEESFGKVVAIGEKADLTDAAIKSAQAIIQTLQEQMDTNGNSNTDWINKLAGRLADLKTKFATSGDIAKTETWKRVGSHLTAPVGLVQAMTGPIPEQDRIALDRAMFKLELFLKYLRLADPLPADNPTRQHEDVLMGFLDHDSWEELEKAKLLVEEMGDGHFKEDIKKVADKITVKCDRILIRQFEPCEFSLECAEGLNRVPAREEWTCKWEFSNAAEPTLSEEGWEVTHYFQRPETYQLKVTLIDKATKEEVPLTNTGMTEIKVEGESRRQLSKVIAKIFTLRWKEAGKEWKKSRTGAGRMLETLWLILSLFIALLGMIAGAKDQILKLDLVPALIAIFLVGFGANEVKNLLTRRPNSAGGNS